MCFACEQRDAQRAQAEADAASQTGVATSKGWEKDRLDEIKRKAAMARQNDCWLCGRVPVPPGALCEWCANPPVLVPWRQCTVRFSAIDKDGLFARASETELVLLRAQLRQKFYEPLEVMQ